MSDELKPCPHCGNNDYVMAKHVDDVDVSSDNFHVVCNWLLGGCGASSGTRRTKDEAVEAWNTRADEPTCKAKQVVDKQADTREKLEADVGNAVCGIYYEGYNDGAVENPNGKRESIDNGTSLMLKLLDRQAVITHEMDNVWAKAQQTKITELKAERDLWNERARQAHDYALELTAERDEWKTKCETREVAYKQADAERKRYSEQIDELFSERDELREKLRIEREAVGVCKGCDKVDSLTAELRHKQNVCDVQRDSFLKLEAENAELRRMLADAAEAI